MKKSFAERMRALRPQLRARGGQIAYCAGVALALTAIAFAAEAYRGGRAPETRAAALPAVEFASSEEAESAARAPEGARLLRAYAASPVWNPALGLWESHAAVDYALDGDVTCLCGGTVRTVGSSGIYGGFAEVESGELLLRYCSISPRAGLAPGDALRAGERIGIADASMPGEAELGAHLHLEALQGGRCVDFEALVQGD